MTNKHRRRWSTSPTSQKVQIKMRRQYFSSTRVANIKTDNSHSEILENKHAQILLLDQVLILSLYNSISEFYSQESMPKKVFKKYLPQH